MSLLAWIVFGSIAGLVAHLLDPKQDQGGMLGAMILGVLGAMMGGFLANIIFGVNLLGFSFTSLSVAILTAFLLLFLGRAFSIERY